MTEKKTGFLGSATVGTKGQMSFLQMPARRWASRRGDKVVILVAPVKAACSCSALESFDMFLQKAGIGEDDRVELAASHKPTK